VLIKQHEEIYKRNGSEPFLLLQKQVQKTVASGSSINDEIRHILMLYK
jgi:hypothetical protein